MRGNSLLTTAVLLVFVALAIMQVVNATPTPELNQMKAVYEGLGKDPETVPLTIGAGNFDNAERASWMVPFVYFDSGEIPK